MISRICYITLGLHSILAVCVCTGVLDVDWELLALLLGSQLPVAAQLLQKDPVLLLKTWAFWPAAILCYVMVYGDCPAEQILGMMQVHLAGACCLVNLAMSPTTATAMALPWIWPMALLALVISCYAVLTPDRELLNLSAAWLVTTVVVLLVSDVLRSHLECQKELETQRDYNQILLQSMPFSQPATCCLRGCPSLVGRSVSRSVSPEELQMNLMSANNPVVVRSSGEFDALFGRKMMGLSLDKAWVPHHTGRQQLKGIFCHEPKDELNITFVDVDGNLFECRVLFPKEVASPSEAPVPASRASRELMVGFCLVGTKRPRLDSNAMTKSKSLPERKSPAPRGSGIVRLSQLPRSPRSVRVCPPSPPSVRISSK